METNFNLSTVQEMSEQELSEVRGGSFLLGFLCGYFIGIAIAILL